MTKATIDAIQAWDKILGTFFEADDRLAIQWAIGAIIAGGPKKILVIYGPMSSGKTTTTGLMEDILHHCIEEDSLPFVVWQYEGQRFVDNESFVITSKLMPVRARSNLIQIRTTGYRLDPDILDRLGQAVHDNRGPIGSRCLQVYRNLGPNHYDNQENHK